MEVIDIKPIIKDWNELSEIPNESKTHKLEVNIDGGYAWLNAKTKKDYDSNKPFLEQIQNLDVYLSTHSFYESQYNNSSEIMKKCGFNVQLDNWG